MKTKQKVVLGTTVVVGGTWGCSVLHKASGARDARGEGKCSQVPCLLPLEDDLVQGQWGPLVFKANHSGDSGAGGWAVACSSEFSRTIGRALRVCFLLSGLDPAPGKTLHFSGLWFYVLLIYFFIPLIAFPQSMAFTTCNSKQPPDSKARSLVYNKESHL